MGMSRKRKPAAPSSPAPAGKRPAGGRQRQQETRASQGGITAPDEDIDAQQHEIHGMIEDAMDPAPERGGTDIERE